MKPTVILINGVSLAGKDTFVSMFKSMFPPKSVKCLSTIDPIKQIYQYDLGWNGEKTPQDRKNLNILKNIWKITSNGPINWAVEEVNRYIVELKYQVVFIMVREYEELIGTKKAIAKSNANLNIYNLNVVRDMVGEIPEVEKEILATFPFDFEYDIVVFNKTVDTFPFVPELYTSTYHVYKHIIDGSKCPMRCFSTGSLK